MFLRQVGAVVVLDGCEIECGSPPMCAKWIAALQRNIMLLDPALAAVAALALAGMCREGAQGNRR